MTRSLIEEKTETLIKQLFPEECKKNKDFRGIVMSPEKNNILEFNQCMKSNKMPYIIYADIALLIKN